MDDLSQTFRLALNCERAPGQIYNIGSFYITREEIAEMIVEVTGSAGVVRTISANEWNGPKFLSDSWEINWEKASQDLGYRPALGREDGAASLNNAIAALAEGLARGRG